MRGYCSGDYYYYYYAIKLARWIELVKCVVAFGFVCSLANKALLLLANELNKKKKVIRRLLFDSETKQKKREENLY